MDFEIPASLLPPLMQAIDADSPLACRLHELGACHGQVVVPSALFDSHSLNTLYQLSRSGNERALMFQMLALDNIYNAPQARVIPALDQLVPGLVAYLTRDAIDGWLYRRNKDGTLLPWLVQGLRYVEPDQGRPYVVIDLLANSMQSANSARHDPQLRRSGMSYSLVINRHDDDSGLSPAQIAARFDLPLLAALPDRPRLRSSASHGHLLLEEAPRDPYVRALAPLLAPANASSLAATASRRLITASTRCPP